MLYRPRRNRKSAPIRKLTQETFLPPSKLVQPLFLLDGVNKKIEINSLPGQYRMTIDHTIKFIESCLPLGIASFIMFPIVEEQKKDKVATYSYDSTNFYLKAARQLKKTFGDQICLISDVAMDPYSSDGHDGLVKGGEILNDPTLDILNKMALAQAQAGFDYIGPSDMMDGRVYAIRQTLDQADYTNTGIISYTAKYASAYYGPFRDALDSAPKAGDKKTYQMNPSNRREALREALLDEEEGADMLMVKPALHYMDIISDLKEESQVPIVCYHVSGECAMLLAACHNGWLDYDQAMPEVLLSLKRAGADIIISYFAHDYAKQFKAY